VVALAATLVPAIRAARTSTVSALNDAARAPRRRAALVRISSGLPVPALFGVRLIARRPRRALLSAANVAVTVAGVVTVISFHVFADRRLSVTVAYAGTALSNPVINRDEQMLTVITILLVALAVLNALFTTWAMVLDGRRSSALMRALGAQTSQVTSGLVTAQVLSALPGAVLGVPLGLALFTVTVVNGTLPPAGWIAAAVVGALAVIGALTVVPALIGSRQPVTRILQSES
jgi:putative ABC transport system permease protein